MTIIWDEKDTDFWMVKVENEIWKEKYSNVWMVEVEEKTILNNIIDTYDIVTNILDSILDTANTHDV